MGCPLCDKLAGLPREDVVAEFPHSVALLGPWQYYAGYCVLVSRVHVAELHHLPEDARRGFVDEACRLCAAIEAEFRPLKLNVESLGNVVPHLHWHVFPRQMDDPERLKAVWLAIDRAERDVGERVRLEAGPRANIVERIRARVR